MGTGSRKLIWSRDRNRNGWAANRAALVKHSSLNGVSLRKAYIWANSQCEAHENTSKDFAMEVTVLWEHELDRLHLGKSAQRS